MKRQTTQLCILLLGLFAAFTACEKDPPAVVLDNDVADASAATLWADATLKVIYRLPANSPTYTSRALGYLGLTMYECVVPGSLTHRSLVGQLNGLNSLPQIELGKRYNWFVALNAGHAHMLRKLFPHAMAFRERAAVVNQLETNLETQAARQESKEVMDRSKAFGVAIAEALYRWSEGDGGHEGFRNNFPLDYVVPTGPGKWTPPIKSQSTSQRPLHPYWGNNRLFLTQNTLVTVPAIIPYSTNRFSQCYAQFLEIYSKNSQLTTAERELAAWWSDDPTETSSPPSHSYNIATIAIKTARANLTTAAEAYARVGMAVADAFINCFKIKYTYFSERPSTYVRAHIDGSWEQYWPEPPFPAFTSGHASQGSAGMTVLADVFGEPFAFTDNTHEGRERDTVQNVDFPIRTFNSFAEAAEECAYSRFLGGIHTRQDNEVGKAQGRQVAYNINRLNWRR